MTTPEERPPTEARCKPAWPHECRTAVDGILASCVDTRDVTQMGLEVGFLELAGIAENAEIAAARSEQVQHLKHPYYA